MKINFAEYFETISRERLLKDLKGSNGSLIAELEIPSSQSYIDISHYYAEASFISEELGPLSEIISAKKSEDSGYCNKIIYEFKIQDIKNFADKLIFLAELFWEEDEYKDNRLEVLETIEEYLSDLDNRKFYCPDLLDEYYANLVYGVYRELANDADYREYLDEEYQKYPERKYGFWNSAHSSSQTYPLYVSTESWVLPNTELAKKSVAEFSFIAMVRTVFEEVGMSRIDWSYHTSVRRQSPWKVYTKNWPSSQACPSLGGKRWAICSARC